MSNLATIVNNILADSGIDDINVVVTNGSYSNPAWITALGWSKITGTPTTIAGYGITNAYTKTEVDTLLNAKQAALNGTGFVVMSGTTVSYDNNYYAIGLASNITTNVQLDDFSRRNGMYRIDPTATNAPSASYWSMIEYGNQNNVIGQLVSHFQTGETYVRAYNTSWSAWRKVWDSVNLPSPQSAITLTTTGTSGAATLIGATLNIPQYQSVLTNPITGTGSTNRIPKFTGSTSIGDSLIFDNSTNISVGTSNNTRLVITDNARIESYYSTETLPRYVLNRDLFGGGLAGIGFTDRDATLATWGVAVGLSAARELGFFVSNGTSLVKYASINSSGATTFVSSVTATNALFNLTSGSDNYPLILKNGLLKANNNFLGFQMSSADASPLTGNLILRGGTDRILQVYAYEEGYGFRNTIIPGGYLGVGITTPVTKLEVFDTDGSGARTSPFNVVTITADNSSNPYDGFGAGLLFKNRIYAGGPSPGGIQNGARIRSSLRTNSSNNYGTELVFDVTTTGNGGLTEALRLSYTDGATFYSTMTANGSVRSRNGGVDGTFQDAFVGVYSSNNNEQNAIQTSVSSIAQSSGFRFQASNGGGSAGRTTVFDLVRDRAVFYTNVGFGAAPATRVTLGSYSGARLPYINGTSNTFDGNGITVCSSNSGSTIGGGLDLTNNTYSVGAYSPIISFSSLSSNSSYNNAYAGIWGVLAGVGVDSNWVAGHLAFGTGDGAGITERMRLNRQGFLGINTTDPTNTLHVVDGSYNRFTIRVQSAAANISNGYGGIGFSGEGANTKGAIFFQSLGLSYSRGRMIFALNNAQDQTNATPSNAVVTLDVNTTYTMSVNGTIYATGDVIAYSDASVKNNIRPIDNVLSRILNSRGVLYDRTDKNEKNNIGFIAQELEQQFPELVSTNTDGTKGVKYQNAVAVLFEAVKELKKEINELKNN